MSYEPYTDRDFIGDQSADIIAILRQIASLLQTIADELKKDKPNG